MDGGSPYMSFQLYVSLGLAANCPLTDIVSRQWFSPPFLPPVSLTAWIQALGLVGYFDSSDEDLRYPTQTPHRETYAVLPLEVFECAHHQEHPTHGFWGWGKSRGGNQIRHCPNPYEASYNPPWSVTTRKGIVDDLNMSFQDVGLLPALGEIRSSQTGYIRRKRKQQVGVSRRQDQPQSDSIFEDIPSDALYMLLPLWPGETDLASVRHLHILRCLPVLVNIN